MSGFQEIAMPIDELLVQTLRILPPAQRQEVLDFAQFLAARTEPKRPLRSVKGLLADLNISISAEDIDEIRKEMWGTFPREDIP
jgi:Protein of unknown function (DUF2281)